MLPRWQTETVRHAHPKRHPQCPGRYQKVHREYPRLLAAAGDTAAGSAKGPDLVARKGQGSGPARWGKVEYMATASSNAGVGLNRDGATTMVAEVAVERASGGPGQPFPRRGLQRGCRGEVNRRRSCPFLGTLRRLEGCDGLWKSGRMDHEREIGEGGWVERP